MQNIGWFPLAIIAGALMGCGMIFAKTATQGMPSYIFVGILGIIWAIGSGSLAVAKQEPLQFTKTVLIFAILAGVFFWIENILRFNALPRAPIMAYVILTIETVGLSIAIIYDLIRLYRSGQIASINKLEVAGFALAAGAVVLFQLAQAQRQKVLVVSQAQ